MVFVNDFRLNLRVRERELNLRKNHFYFIFDDFFLSASRSELGRSYTTRASVPERFSVSEDHLYSTSKCLYILVY